MAIEAWKEDEILYSACFELIDHPQNVKLLGISMTGLILVRIGYDASEMFEIHAQAT